MKHPVLDTVGLCSTAVLVLHTVREVQECTSSVCVANEHGTGISAPGKLLRGDAPLVSLGIQSGSKIQLKLGLLGGVWANAF